MSATEAVRVKRGSMTTSLAPFSIFASITHLKPHGCASAALPPMTTTTLAFLMSCQVLVIAPRPNDGARLATVGPCQTRAWLSNTTIPRDRATFQVMKEVSLDDADAANMPVDSQRLTVVPSLFLAMKFLSLSSFISLAMRSSAKSQDTSLNSFAPGARYLGTLRRPGEWTMSRSADPFGHSVPRL